jgi:hypothetical protein
MWANPVTCFTRNRIAVQTSLKQKLLQRKSGVRAKLLHFLRRSSQDNGSVSPVRD